MSFKIAVIEDDVGIANMYCFKLRQHGYEVASANNGHTGISLIARFKPSLILLDLMMPGMNGDEMLEKVRANDMSSHIRVIILTNISKDEAPSNLRFLNIDRYIVKAHHTPSQVVSIVDEILATRKN